MQRISRGILFKLVAESPPTPNALGSSSRLCRHLSTSLSSSQNSQIQQTPPGTKSSVPLNPPVKWDLFAGVVLERKPLLTRDMTELEKEYSAFLATLEVEQSRKSTFEVRKAKESILLEKIKSGALDPDQAPAITAQDEEDLWSVELAQFKAESRTTDQDKANNLQSLDRALDSHLLLLIEQKLGTGYTWMCPQGLWKDGETMRQTAERILKQVCPEVKAKVLGNAPWGVYKYKYPNRSVTEQKLSAVGAKVFFFKAQVISGDIKPTLKTAKDKTTSDTMATDYKDFAWCTREDLISKLQPEYHKQIREILIDEAN